MCVCVFIFKQNHIFLSQAKKNEGARHLLHTLLVLSQAKESTSAFQWHRKEIQYQYYSQWSPVTVFQAKRHTLKEQCHLVGQKSLLEALWHDDIILCQESETALHITSWVRCCCCCCHRCRSVLSVTDQDLGRITNQVISLTNLLFYYKLIFTTETFPKPFMAPKGPGTDFQVWN